MQETQVQSQGQEDPWRGTWQPTPVFLPIKYCGQRSQVGHAPWGLKESDMTEHRHMHACRHALAPWIPSSPFKMQEVSLGTPPPKGTNLLMWPLLLSEVFSSLSLNDFPHNWQPQSHLHLLLSFPLLNYSPSPEGSAQTGLQNHLFS